MLRTLFGNLLLEHLTSPTEHETSKSKQGLYPRSKLTEYLLSRTHSVGKWKSKFFRALGFNETNVDSLEEGLISIANSEDIKDVIPSKLGTKYVIEGSLKTPAGTFVSVRTVWIIEEGQDHPRFVTAYPIR